MVTLGEEPKGPRTEGSPSTLDGRKPIGICALDDCRSTAYKRLQICARRIGRRIPRQLKGYDAKHADDPRRFDVLMLCPPHFMRAYRAQRAGHPLDLLFETRRSKMGLTDEQIAWARKTWARERRRPGTGMSVQAIADELGVSYHVAWKRLTDDYRMRDEGRVE